MKLIIGLKIFLMKFSLTKTLLVIGVILLNNLYVFLGKPFLICLIILNIFLILKRPATKTIINNSLNLFYILVLLFSIIFLCRFFDNKYFDYVVFDDFFRIIPYLIYFNTIIVYSEKIKSIFFLKKLVFYSLNVAIILGFIQYIYPQEFNDLVLSVGGEHLGIMSESKFRVGGTWLDPNTYAASLCIFYGIYKVNKFKERYSILDLYFLTAIGVLINLSGSRLGLVMFGFIILKIGFSKLSLKKIIGIAFFTLFSILVLKVYVDNMNVGKNVTLLVRLLGNNERLKFEASHSTNLRFQTFENGLKFSKEHLGIGHGIFLFKPYYWNYNQQKERYHNYPHNWYIYTIAEFGFLSIILFGFILYWFIKSNKRGSLFVYFLFTIKLMLLSNIMYYPSSFLCITFFVLYNRNLIKDEDSIHSPIIA